MNETLKRGAIALAMAAMGVAVVLGGCSKKADTSQPITTVAASASDASGGTTAATDASGQPAVTPSTAKPGQSTATSTGDQRVTVGGKTEAEWKTALPGLEQAAKASPTDTKALQDLAVAQYQLKDYAGAAATYQQMLKIKDDPTTHNNYANVLRDSNQTDAALAQYDLAIKGDAALTVAYANKASLLASTKRQAEALVVYDALIAANPAYFGGYTAKARLLATEKKVAEAIKILDDGLAKVPAADQAKLSELKKQLGG